MYECTQYVTVFIVWTISVPNVVYAHSTDCGGHHVQYVCQRCHMSVPTAWQLCFNTVVHMCAGNVMCVLTR